MNVEYIYASGSRIWSDEAGHWLFSEPYHDHSMSLAVYELGLSPDQSQKLIVMPDLLSDIDIPPVGLRQLLMGTDDSGFALLSRAAQVTTWHQNHQYCPRCGSGLEHHNQDLAKECVKCGLLQYPRISPCIITLVTDGDYCLLAQGIRFNGPMFSTLAGFIEAGESAEQALVREVKEEVGVDVKNINYFGSQPWPFPHSLMLGYFAEYDGGEIVPQPDEIIEARWFHYTELETAPIPPKLSISRALIDSFIENRSGHSEGER